MCVCVCVCVCVCGCGQILCQKIKSGYNAVCNKCFICYIVINFKTLFPSKQNFVAQHFTILKNTCFKMFASEKKKVHNSIKCLKKYWKSLCCCTGHMPAAPATTGPFLFHYTHGSIKDKCLPVLMPCPLHPLQTTAAACFLLMLVHQTWNRVWRKKDAKRRLFFSWGSSSIKSSRKP